MPPLDRGRPDSAVWSRVEVAAASVARNGSSRGDETVRQGYQSSRAKRIAVLPACALVSTVARAYYDELRRRGMGHRRAASTRQPARRHPARLPQNRHRLRRSDRLVTPRPPHRRRLTRFRHGMSAWRPGTRSPPWTDPPRAGRQPPHHSRHPRPPPTSSGTPPQVGYFSNRMTGLSQTQSKLPAPSEADHAGRPVGKWLPFGWVDGRSVVRGRRFPCLSLALSSRS